MYELEKTNLKRCSKYVTQVLRPSDVKEFMNCYLDRECVERILSEEQISVTSAAQVLLERVCQLEEEGWFQALLDALQASEYSGLYEAMREWDFRTLESTQEHRRLLDRIEPSFTKLIKPAEVLTHLGECLSQRECEEIQATQTLKGSIAAAEKLTECLKRSDKHNWFKLLKLALEQCELHEALDLLEPPDTDDQDEEGGEEKGSETMTMVFHYKEEGDGDDEGLLKSANDMTQSETPPSSAAEPSRDQGQQTGEKRLREYQRELAGPVFRGHNSIICAPTGCGKTVVALAICEQHLQTLGSRAKVVFMATKVDVFHQQYKLFRDHFAQKYPDVRIQGLCGTYGDQVSMAMVVENNDIIVLTPQCLVNAMKRGDVASLSCFTLLILDECHNTTGKHPYNVLMTHYLDTKHSSEHTLLPQIVGLTASVGIGAFRNQAEAENNICQLCASLDVRIISTVDTHTDELHSYVHIPDKDFFLVPKREKDPFVRIIHKIMADIEDLAKTVYDIGSLSNIKNRDYGSQKYEQWIVDVQKKCRVLQVLKDQEEESRVCRALFNYTEHLRKYNDALIINEDARTKDALEYLSAFITQVKNAGHEQTERQLTKAFDAQQVHLRGLANGGQQQNPKLEELQFILQEEYRNNKETRSVLFVRTRALAEALKKWIEETDSLKFLKPGVLIGRGRKTPLTGSGGMTLTSKKGVLDSFKSSDQSKILIATSVADEGIDIPQCNLVLMYEYVGNVVKMVQVRGRGRAEGSKCILVSNKKEYIDKEKHNLQKEKIVDSAVKRLKAEPTEMLLKINVFQREDKVRREQVRLTPERPRTEGIFELMCAKCKKSACYSDNIRVLQNSHHIVLDHSLFSRAQVRPHPHPGPMGSDSFVKTKKLYCLNCKHDWGIVASYQFIQDLPVIKIESFVVQNCITRVQRYYRKWRDVTFAMKPFDITDIPQNWGPLPEDQ